MKIRNNVLNELILDVNQTIVDWNHWQAVLDKLCAYVSNGKGAITIRSNEMGHIDINNIPNMKTFEFEDKFFATYTNTQYKHDVWTGIEQRHEVGQLVIFGEHLPMKELCKLKYYIEWLKPQNLTDGIAVPIFRTKENRVVLNIIHNDSSENLVKLCEDLKILIPHMVQAISIRMKIAGDDNGEIFKTREKYLKNRFGFTEAEVKVATAIVRANSKEIAREFNRSISTIKKHLNNIRIKMEVKTTNEAIMKLYGLIDFKIPIERST